MNWLAVVAVIALPASAIAQNTPVAIENATVWVQPDQKIEGATVVIRDGKIAAVGKGAAVPAGATKIDGTGKIVTAGFIEASSRIGLVEVDLESSTVEGQFEAAKNEDAVHAAYRVNDGFNAGTVAIPITRTGGVTTAISVPSGGLISGTSAAYAMSDGKSTELLVADELAMYTTLGEGSQSSAEGSRGVAVEKLRELFDDARDYSRRKSNYDRNQTRDYAARRLDLAALVKVLRRQMPLVVHVDRSSDILTALALGKELNIQIAIAGGVESWKVAKEIVAAKATVIVNPLSNLPGSFDRIYVVDDLAKRLREAGVNVVISTTGESANARNLRQLAGNAVANGMKWEDALAAITTAPADAFAIGKRGTLKKGSVADVVVWSGDPFELSSRAEVVLIAGQKQSLETRQTKLLRRYRKLPATRRGGDKSKTHPVF